MSALEQARRWLENNGYVITAQKGGSYSVLNSATQETVTGTAADIIALAGELEEESIRPPWWNPVWGKIPRDDNREVLWDTAFKIADKMGAFGESRFYTTSYTEAQREAAKRTNATASQAARGAGTPAFTFEVVPLGDGYTVQVKVAEAPSGAMSQVEAEAEAARLGERYEAIRDPATGQWYVQLKGQKPGEGTIVKSEDLGLPPGSFFIRDPDGSLRPYTPEKAEKPGEQFLGTVEEGGWQIDQYGVPDPNGEYTDPETGQTYRITARHPRQPIKDPILSLDDLISQALVDVDFNDPSDPGRAKAQALFDFKNQPTSQEKLQMALQIAQSPSDYLTLVALYTGAIQRESPAKVGERIAPLAPILQMMAQQFFLDIPGINHVPTQEETAATRPATAAELEPGEPATEEEEGLVTPPVVPPTDTGAGGLPAPYDTVAANGRYYDSVNGVWEDWDAYIARTGGEKGPPLPGEETYAGAPVTPVTPVPEDRPTIPMAASLTAQAVPGLLGGGVTVPGQGGPPVPAQGPGGAPAIGQQLPGLLGTQPSSGNAESLIKTLVSAVKSLGSVQQSQTTAKPLTVQQQVQQAQGTQVSPKLAASLGTKTIGETEEQRRKRLGLNRIPGFQYGGVVPGYLGQPRLAQVEGGETVLTPAQIQALLQQSGMFGPVFRPDLQQLPQFLAQPRRVSLAELTGGALRPRSLQTIRQQSPTQRMLTLEMAKGFGVPGEDFLEEERMATSIGGPRRMARFQPSTIRTGR